MKQEAEIPSLGIAFDKQQKRSISISSCVKLPLLPLPRSHTVGQPQPLPSTGSQVDSKPGFAGGERAPAVVSRLPLRNTQSVLNEPAVGTMSCSQMELAL